MLLKDADGIANSVDPDKTASLVLSGSALFAQAYLSENLGSLWYYLSLLLQMGHHLQEIYVLVEG